MRFFPAIVGLVFAIGCAPPAPQVVTGRIDPGFPAQITTVKVTTSSIVSWHGDAVMATSPVAADGTFRLEIQPSTRLHIQLLADNGRTTVVFPRQVGGVRTVFTVRPNGAPFDLGGIRFLGDASVTPFVFRVPGTTTDMECDDDGMDANGSMCVDDNDDDQNTCGQDDDNEQEGEHEDGDEQDGNHEDGDDDANETEHPDRDDGPDMGDAMAEHNFPADGCSDDDGESDDEEDD